MSRKKYDRNYLTYEVKLPEIDLPSDITGRQRNNFKILQLGYNLLSDYVNELKEELGFDWQLPPKSWDLILTDARTAKDENPIIELIRWAYESDEKAVFPLEDDSKIGISTVELMRIQNAPWGPKLPLPFEKHTAFGRWLEDHLGASKERVFYNGKQRRVYVVDYEKVIMQ